MNILAMMSGLFAQWFTGSSWNAWRTFLRVLFCLPMDADDVATYQRHTNRAAKPPEPFREAWVIVGRRGGKSLVAALVAVFLACFKDHREYLKPGEIGVIAVVAENRDQAQIVLGFIKAFLQLPILKDLVINETKESIDLKGSVRISVQTASFRTTRGRTYIAVICDETAYWRSEESANPDTEIIAAVRPGLTTTRGLLLVISSPYSRKGALWNTYARHFGREESRVLVWQSDSKSMNPTLEDSLIAEAYEDDPASAAAEYGGLFRTDLESFIDSVLAGSLVIAGRYELEPAPGVRHKAFGDAAGGSGQDSYAICIAHPEHDKVVIDLLHEVKPPFSPEQTTAAFAETLRRYGIRKICLDRYAGSWPGEQFGKFGIQCEPSAKSKSEIYKEALPMFNNRKVELLDNPKMLTQLCNLERRTSRSGNDQIDHPVGQHDDLINVVCGAMLQCAKPSRMVFMTGGSEDLLLINGVATWARPGVAFGAPAEPATPEPAEITPERKSNFYAMENEK